MTGDTLNKKKKKRREKKDFSNMHYKLLRISINCLANFSFNCFLGGVNKLQKYSSIPPIRLRGQLGC